MKITTVQAKLSKYELTFSDMCYEDIIEDINGKNPNLNVTMKELENCFENVTKLPKSPKEYKIREIMKKLINYAIKQKAYDDFCTDIDYGLEDAIFEW